MATESTEEHGKIKTPSFMGRFFFAIQHFSKQPLYRALNCHYKIFLFFCVLPWIPWPFKPFFTWYLLITPHSQETTDTCS